MDSSSIYKGFSYLLVFLLAALSFPIIPGWIPPLQKIWVILVMAFLAYTALTPKISWGNSTSCLLFYFVVLFLNAKMGDVLIPTTQIAIVEVLFLYVPSAVALWCFSQENISFIKTVLIVSLALFAIEAVSSFITLQVEPMIIRTLYKIATDEGDTGIMFEYYRTGLMDYSMAHAIPILIPPLFYAYKKVASTVKSKIFLLTSIAGCVFLTWLSDSTTALMLAVLFLVIGFLTNVSDIRRNFRKLIIIGIIVLPIAASDDVQLAVLDAAETVLGSESVFADKIEEFRYSIENKGNMTGDMQGRVDRYNKSLDMFFTNPLWGTNTKPGNHASLIDRLGAFGLLGFIPLMFFFWYSLKHISAYLPADSLVFFIQGILAAMVMLGTKGMWNWSMFYNLFILLPFIIYYTNEKYLKRC